MLRLESGVVGGETCITELVLQSHSGLERSDQFVKCRLGREQVVLSDFASRGCCVAVA